jgi:dTMP kinase
VSGCFLVLEGPGGSGKSTQARLLVEALRGGGLDVVLTAEPTQGVIGKHIRAVTSAGRGTDPIPSRELALLFQADREAHLREVILPALARGSVVVSDRHVLSSRIYQILAEPSLGAWVASLHAYERAPDLTLVLQVSPQVAIERVAARAGEKLSFHASGVLEKACLAYQKPAYFVPDETVRMVAGEAPPSRVHSHVLSHALAALRWCGLECSIQARP